MGNETNQSYVVDGIKTIAIHNDVVRIQFMTLDNAGQPQDSLRLLVPQRQIKAVADALARIPAR